MSQKYFDEMNNIYLLLKKRLKYITEINKTDITVGSLSKNVCPLIRPIIEPKKYEINDFMRKKTTD